MATGRFKRMMMTLFGGFSLLFVLACGTIDTVAAQPLQRMIVGINSPSDVITTGAYCVGVDESFMRAFTSLISKRGIDGYWQFILQPGSPCYDTRMTHVEVKPVRATLIKRLWEFALPSGKRYVLWEVRDKQNVTAYAWTRVLGQEA